ncbi:hypothetical protein SEA_PAULODIABOLI_69 [Microbacterium phage PauloDiaboli]|nr:hypothetical protein SEA_PAULODIABOLI_69 [Microbacterium phage PauloDiaboli]QWY83920.1 hypothetical protein SEA_A3WALLY_70 [Microbacterium phage A3Wally]
MAQVWRCDRCGYTTWGPKDAGDHERKYYGELTYPGIDEDGKPRHYMEDLGE